MANSVDPDQTPHSAASDLDIHCLDPDQTPHYVFLSLSVRILLNTQIGNLQACYCIILKYIDHSQTLCSFVFCVNVQSFRRYR